MKFEIKTNVIKEYMKKVSSLVPIFSALPHESGVLVTVDQTSLSFKVKNEHIKLKIETNDIGTFNIHETGKVLFKGKMVNEIISRMNGEKIIFTKIDNNILIIEGEDAQYEINLLNVDNYENFDINISANETSEMIIHAGKIKTAIQKVSPAVPDKHQRKILQGINVKTNGDELMFTATNGTRIHRSTIPQSSNLNIDSTISIKSTREILKVLSDNKEAKFKFSGNLLIIEDKELTIQTTLMNGGYPDLSKAFDFEFDKTLFIEKDEFISLIDRTTLLGPGKTENGITKMIINNGEIKFEVREIEIGYSHVTTKEFEFNYPERFEITFSPKYMEDAVKAVDEKTLKISMADSIKPIKITSKEEVNFIAIVLPYRTN